MSFHLILKKLWQTAAIGLSSLAGAKWEPTPHCNPASGNCLAVLFIPLASFRIEAYNSNLGSLGYHHKYRDMKTFLCQSDILILSGRANTTNLLPTQDLQ